MKYFVLNTVHGFGPILRLLEVGEGINKEMRRRELEPYGFIIPGLSDRQNEIVREEFSGSGFIYDIFIDHDYGAQLKSVHYKGDDHRDFLRELQTTQPEAQGALDRYFTDDFTVHSFVDNESVIVRPGECYELARNPLVKLPFSGFMYTFGFRSDILRYAQSQGREGYDKALIDPVLALLEEPEAPRDIDFVQDPSAVLPRRDFVATPLHQLKKPSNSDHIESGIYVSLTGIEGLRHSIAQTAQDLGLKIYCPKSARDQFSDAIVTTPDIVTNPHIEAVFTRFGWGGINLALMNQKPLITVPDQTHDDPEIWLNNHLIVNQLEFGSILDQREVAEVIEESRRRAQDLEGYLADMDSSYGTIEGPKYAAKKIVDYLHPGA